MSVKSSTPNPGTTPMSLVASIPDQSGNNYEVARTLVIHNTGSVTVWLGGVDVSPGNAGFALAVGERVSFDLSRGDEVFACVTSGTGNLRVLHLGV